MGCDVRDMCFLLQFLLHQCYTSLRSHQLHKRPTCLCCCNSEEHSLEEHSPLQSSNGYCNAAGHRKVGHPGDGVVPSCANSAKHRTKSDKIAKIKHQALGIRHQLAFCLWLPITWLQPSFNCRLMSSSPSARSIQQVDRALQHYLEPATSLMLLGCTYVDGSGLKAVSNRSSSIFAHSLVYWSRITK